MMMSGNHTIDSGFDSGSSPELHATSLEEPPMSRTHQYRKVRLSVLTRLSGFFLVYSILALSIVCSALTALCITLRSPLCTLSTVVLQRTLICYEVR